MRLGTRFALFGLLVVFSSTAAIGQTTANTQGVAPSNSDVRELQERLQSLEQQLNELKSTNDSAARRRIMQQNWQGMQEYMGWMHDRWGMGYPWMMGPGMMGGYGWMGCPMMGNGRTGWPLPGGMSSTQYWQQMRDHMQRMQEQMNRIAQSTDPQERERLMQEHWRSMYQDMQTMRGMGWMWSGPMGPGMMGGGSAPTTNTAKPLPEPSSAGAKLVTAYCTQCHAAPSPTLHAAGDWSTVTSRMQGYMNSAVPGIKTPSKGDMDAILSYMQKHAQ